MSAKRIAVAIAIAALVAAGCSSPKTNTGSTQAQQAPAAAQASNTSKNSQGGSGGQAALDSANFASGRVKSINGTTIQVSTATEVLAMKTTSDTKIQKITTGSLSDVQTGQTISVRGTREADGTLTAQMIQIGGSMGGGMPGAGGPVPGGQGTPAPGAPTGNGGGASGAPADNGAGAPPAGPQNATGMPAPGAGGGGRGQGNQDNLANGQVKQVNGDTIQITTTNEVVTVKVSDKTQYQKTVDAALSDVVVDQRITAQGSRGSDNTFTAQTIQLGTSSAGGGQPAPGQQAPATPAASK